MGDWRVLTDREEILGVSFFAKSKPINRNNSKNYSNGPSLVLKHNGVMSIDLCFCSSPVLYLSVFYDTVRVGLLASSKGLILVFGFSKIIFSPKTL